MTKTYAITGITGYIGSQFLEYLLKNTDDKIIGIVRDKNDVKVKENERLKYVTYNNNEWSLENAIKESDYLIHLGALYTTLRTPSAVKELNISNILFSTQIFNVASRVNPNIKIVTASTFSSLDETGNYKPASLYAATKKAVEDIAEAYNDLSINFLTLPDTYGPNDWRNKVHNLAMKNDNFEFLSYPEQEIALLYIDDIIGHFLSVLTNAEIGIHYFDIFSTAPIIKLEDLAKIVCKESYSFKKVSPIVKLPYNKRSFSEDSNYKNKFMNIEETFKKKILK